ncbi:IS3 family transposase [Rhodococcus hoagii]|nr:IS3 family transposase [Prescottella equi]
MQAACRLLDVSGSGYYDWRSRPPSQRAIRHAWLLDQIGAVHTASRGTYGCHRVHAELTVGLGISVGHNQVEMLMARAGIKGLPGTRRARPKHQTPAAGDLVNRSFARSQPNQIHVLGFHRPSPPVRTVAFDGFDRRLLRQCSHRILLGKNANRASEPATLENEDPTGQRHL